MAESSVNADDLVDEFAKMSTERTAASASLPPAMAQKREYTTDQLLKEMNKVPLFMTSIDENDEEQAAQLEAIRALAYEGTRAEIATNFKSQGNECVAQKLWSDAREFYSKAIIALQDPELKTYEAPDVQIVEIDEEGEKAKERELAEACLANRALCNLEMSITAIDRADAASCADTLSNRELWRLQTRLCCCFAAQSSKRQSLVSCCLSVSCSGQGRGST